MILDTVPGWCRGKTKWLKNYGQAFVSSMSHHLKRRSLKNREPLFTEITMLKQVINYHKAVQLGRVAVLTHQNKFFQNQRFNSGEKSNDSSNSNEVKRDLSKRPSPIRWDKLRSTENLEKRRKALEELENLKKEERFYKLAGVRISAGAMGISGAVFIVGVVWHIYDLIQKEEERKAELGRNLVREIEINKEKMYEFILRLEKMEKVSHEELILLDKTFGYILRYISAYDTSIIPEKLKIECEYQLQSLRKVITNFDASSDKFLEEKNILKECLSNCYNVINIASVVASAATVKKHLRCEEEELVYHLFYEDNSCHTVDEIRMKYADKQIEQLNKLHEEKKAYSLKYSLFSHEKIRDSVNFDFKEELTLSIRNRKTSSPK